ncbi:hypothetical protein C8J56DRAFT_1048510 [Mycena floridula]|nr:hypothetical protein C8J56DRAFT_1048510 [Mycena floridula]
MDTMDASLIFQRSCEDFPLWEACAMAETQKLTESHVARPDEFADQSSYPVFPVSFAVGEGALDETGYRTQMDLWSKENGWSMLCLLAASLFSDAPWLTRSSFELHVQMLEHHPFWQQASALLDLLDLMAAQAYLHHGSHSSANFHSNSILHPAYHGGIHSQSRVSPYHHFHSLFSISCLVCRISHPSTNHGLAAVKRDVAIDIKDQKPGKVKPGTMFTALFGLAPLCKENNKKRMRFCGLCLGDSVACYQSREI